MAKKSLELKTDVSFHTAEPCQALSYIIVQFQISKRSLPHLFAPEISLLRPLTALTIAPLPLHWILDCLYCHSLVSKFCLLHETGGFLGVGALHPAPDTRTRWHDTWSEHSEVYVLGEFLRHYVPILFNILLFKFHYFLFLDSTPHFCLFFSFSSYIYEEP